MSSNGHRLVINQECVYIARSVLQVPYLVWPVRGPLEPSRIGPGRGEDQPGSHTQAGGLTAETLGCSPSLCHIFKLITFVKIFVDLLMENNFGSGS